MIAGYFSHDNCQLIPNNLDVSMTAMFKGILCPKKKKKTSEILTSNNAFAARTCTVGVVVTHESNMASYFLEAGNLIGSNSDMCSDVAAPSSSGWGDLFELSDRSNKTNTRTTGHQLGFESDYNSHTAFRGALRRNT